MLVFRLMAREIIKRSLEKAVPKAFPELLEGELISRFTTLEHPKDLSFGDYSTPVALSLKDYVSKSPKEIASILVEELRKDKSLEEVVLKIELAGAGFINFYMTPGFFINSIKEISEAGEKFGRNDSLKEKLIMVEYTDPNPFKEFHIGHLMSNAIGEAITRILEGQGAKVLRANYQGDVGLHVAKAIWGIGHMNEPPPEEEVSLKERIAYIGKAYVLGSSKYEEDETAQAEIKIINKKIFEKSDEEINKIYEKGRAWTLEKFEEIYSLLGTKFDYYFFESQFTEMGAKIVEEFRKKGVFEESNGAVIFPAEKYGLHTRVFINSQGLPTYEAKDLGLNITKFEKEPKLEKSIIITASEQSGYFSVLIKALEQIRPDVAKKMLHLSHGMMRLKNGKMSSRKGNVVTGEEILEEAVRMAEEKMKHTVKVPESEKENVAKMVAIGAVKYSILRQEISKDIAFDFDESVSFEGNSGPYIQYTYARAKSLLDKAEEEGIFPKIVEGNGLGTSEIEKLLYRFPEIIEKAGEKYAPHYIATYLCDIAQSFNAYYNKNRIVDKDDPFSCYRVLLAKAVSHVLLNGLVILGIPAPQKM